MGKASNVVIYDDPWHSPLEVVGDVVFALGPGCTAEAASLIVSPDVQFYREQQRRRGAQFRQEVHLLVDAESQRLRFHLDDPDPTHRTAHITVGRRRFRVIFGTIGKSRLDPATGQLSQQGQWFPHYVFNIEWDD
jgi:hypothetical protein